MTITLMSPPGILAVVLAICGYFALSEVQAFLPPMQITTNIIISSNHASSTSTALSMGKRKKPSMKERRKQRAKRQPVVKVERGLLDDLPAVDAWEKTQPTVAATTPAPDDQAEDAGVTELDETASKASALVEAQRASVDSLTFVRRRVEESFPMSDAVKSIVEKGYFVHDGFLSANEDEEFGDALISTMLQEGSDMLSNDKLERDITRLGDGEYLAKIVGGEAYADCPRLTEYVVSLTRHLPPLFNKEIDALEGDISRLDGTASMGTLRVYDRKTKLGASTLLVNPETGDGDIQDRPFGVVCGDTEGTENDTRRLTAMLFLSSKDWDASVCGGGVTVEQGERLDAIRDRIILLQSDACSHRQEPWKGEDKPGLDQAGCVVVHFAFLPPMQITTNIIISSNHASSTSTALSMGKRKKPSMKERRKQRAKRQPVVKVERGLLDDLPAVDAWEKTQPTVAATTPAPDDQAEDAGVTELDETASKASALVEAQRASVDSLTFVRRRVEESFPMSDAVKSIVEKGYFVHDGFLSANEDEEFGDALISTMLQEGSDMLSNDKLERDITRLGDGEYLAKIVGGEAYADCPRLTEYVVSLTRHLPPLFNKEIDALEGDISRLDGTASMGTLRVYDRKTKLGASTLLVNPETGDGDIQDRPFGVVCGDTEGTENDTRRLTAMLFLSSKDWDASVCGGGVTVEQGERLDAIRDRIILLQSDACSHRQEPWKGEDKPGLDQAGCVVVHFVKA
ncbi:hypothetical protein ACHAXR_011437 [Thalassiosira sp. AJA248-18]